MYASDFLVDTSEMTDKEVGVYIRLLCTQWVNGSINSDPNRLANGVTNGVLDVWDEIKHNFEKGKDGRLRNPRLEQIRTGKMKYLKGQSEAGKKGAEKRWKNHGNPNSKSMATPLSTPIAKRCLSSSSSNNILSEFNEFKKQYPGRKRGLEIEFADLKNKHKDYKQVIPIILTSLNNQIKARKDASKIKAFVPEWKNLKTWLYQRCWEEEPAKLETQKKTEHYGTTN